MKIWGKLVLFLIIAVPIIVGYNMIVSIWKDDDGEIIETNNGGTDEQSTTPEKVVEDITGYVEEQTQTMAGETFTSSIGNPIGKIVEGATIAISVANVYEETDENSTVLARLEKHTVVTTQAYPEGWTRIKNSNVSGWVRTENIELPDESGDTSLGSAVGRTGIVTVDGLRIRSQASTSGSILNTLLENTEVVIAEVSGDWYKIKYKNTEGWVSSNYIKIK